MGDKKRTYKLLKKLLKDDNKRSLYTKEEILYLEKQLIIMKIQRAAHKLTNKKTKGFGYE
tara:strand:- start:297 stop:476 length:180 start_codon:yes stop_codon:yes gene_type:complete